MISFDCIANYIILKSKDLGLPDTKNVLKIGQNKSMPFLFFIFLRNCN